MTPRAALRFISLTLERKIIAGFGVAAVLLQVAGTTAWWNTKRLKDSHLLVDHTHEVLIRLEQVLTNELSMETSTRGFVITGADDVLAPYERNRVELDVALDELRKLVVDNPPQLERLRDLEFWTNSAGEIMRERIAARRARGLQSTLDTDRFLAGQRAVETVRSRIQML
ncbi:MAG TPA: CHASE3 domain-containing protein, partial [Opitutaceae bacterium]|nr:CHASE3 domain-containing protein [Opitutaceae bacterium]